VGTRTGHKLLGAILVERGACSVQDVERALAEQARGGGHVGEILQAMGRVDRQQVLTALGVQAGLELADIERTPPQPAVLKRLDAATCHLFRVVPLREEVGKLVVALADLLNVSIL